MTYEISEFKGDETYRINCTGDACVGDEVAFERATFSGSFRNPRFDGFERIYGKIIKDSYGREKQQHTFTLLLENGLNMRIKGRNLYANGTFRKKWDDESKRDILLKDKHKRGDEAREARRERRKEEFYCN